MKYSLIGLLMLLGIGQAAIADILKDPTKPPSQTVVSSSSANGQSSIEQAEGAPEDVSQFVLSAIYLKDSGRYAVINNSVVSEGQVWNNLVIQAVNHDSVVLASNEELEVISIFKSDIAKESEYVY